MLVPKLLTCMNDLCIFFCIVHYVIHHQGYTVTEYYLVD